MAEKNVALKLPVLEWSRIFELGTKARIQELKHELARVEQDIASFERKYGMTLTEWEQAGVPLDMEAHEDWIEWSALVDYRANLLERINTMKSLIESSNAG